MKRLTIRVVWILLFGMMVTYLWTWGWAVRTTTDSRAGPAAPEEHHPLRLRLDRQANFDRYVWIERAGRGWETQTMMASDSRYATSSPLNTNRIIRTEAGWPVRMLAMERRSWRSERSEQGFFEAPEWIQREDGNGMKQLPCLPVWPGFILGVVAFGTLSYLPLAFFDVRRLRRARRGWCLKCGYDLQSQRKAAGPTRCPECGKAGESSA